MDICDCGPEVSGGARCPWYQLLLPQGSGLVRLTEISQRIGRETAISALRADDLISLALATAADADGERTALDAVET